MDRSERVGVIIDDVVQLCEIPTPLVVTDTEIEALCPFCGKCRAKVSIPVAPEAMAHAYVALVGENLPALLRHFKECSEPLVNLMLRKVLVVYSFEGLRDTLDEFDIQLSALEIVGEDKSIKML